MAIDRRPVDTCNSIKPLLLFSSSLWTIIFFRLWWYLVIYYCQMFGEQKYLNDLAFLGKLAANHPKKGRTLFVLWWMDSSFTFMLMVASTFTVALSPTPKYQLPQLASLHLRLLLFHFSSLLEVKAFCAFGIRNIANLISLFRPKAATAFRGVVELRIEWFGPLT